jgi:hypothetical protein
MAIAGLIPTTQEDPRGPRAMLIWPRHFQVLLEVQLAQFKLLFYVHIFCDEVEDPKSQVCRITHMGRPVTSPNIFLASFKIYATSLPSPWK